MEKIRKGALRYGPALAVMLAIFWFSAQPADEVALARDTLIARVLAAVQQFLPAVQPAAINWLKVGHGIGYALLGAACLHAIGPGRKRAGLWAVLAAAVYALTDELHQMFVPGRGAGLIDVAIDTLAAAGAVVFIELVRQIRCHSFSAAKERYRFED